MSDNKEFSYARAAHVIDRRDAQIVTDALTAEGIQCWTNLNNVGSSDMTGGPSGVIITVLKDDLERTKQIIAEL